MSSPGLALRRLSPFLAVLLVSCAAPERFRFGAPAADAWTALPLRLENERPYVDLEVNGKRVAVLFDLGAGATVWLEPAAAEAAGARFTGDSSMYTDAFGVEHRCRAYVLDECRAGDFVFRDVEGRERAEEPNLLGWRLLRPFRVLVDYPGRRIVLATGNALPPDVHPETWVRVPFRLTGSGIVTDAVMDGRTLEFVWDTGASRSILKPGRGAPQVKSFQLAGHEFGPQEFTVLDLAEPPGDGLVGQPFFEQHRVLIDWEAGVLGIEDAAR